MFAIYGVQPDQFTPSYQAWIELILPEDRPAVEATLQQAIEAESELTMDFRIRRPGGETAAIYILGYVYRDGGGLPLRVVCFNQDITERKASENAY